MHPLPFAVISVVTLCFCLLLRLRNSILHHGRPKKLPHSYPYRVTAYLAPMTASQAIRVQQALNRIDGVLARVSRQQKRAVIYCRGPVNETLLRRAIASAGCCAVRFVLPE